MKLGNLFPNQQGLAAIELLLLTALVLMPAVLMLLTFPIWVEYRSLGDAVAREAIRACAIAGPHTGQTQSQAVAQHILSERGLRPDNISVDIDCPWQPGQEVEARVTFRVPALGISGLGSLEISRSYREKVGPHRSL